MYGMMPISPYLLSIVKICVRISCFSFSFSLFSQSPDPAPILPPSQKPSLIIGQAYHISSLHFHCLVSSLHFSHFNQDFHLEPRNCDGSHITCTVYSLIHSLGRNVSGPSGGFHCRYLQLLLFCHSVYSSTLLLKYSSTRSACTWRAASLGFFSHFFKARL